jgi:hypothetical protein
VAPDIRPRGKPRSDGRWVDVRDVFRVLGIALQDVAGYRAKGMGGTGWWASPEDKARVDAYMAAHGIRLEHGPLRWEGPGDPCAVLLNNDRWGSSPCGRMAVAGETCGRLGAGVGGEQVPACKLHVSVRRRVQANQARRDEEAASRRSESDRARLHREQAKALQEWAHPRLAELGIHPATVTVETVGRRVGLLLPPEAIATLIELVTGDHYTAPPPGDNHGQ